MYCMIVEFPKFSEKKKKQSFCWIDIIVNSIFSLKKYFWERKKKTLQYMDISETNPLLYRKAVTEKKTIVLNEYQWKRSNKTKNKKKKQETFELNGNI
jgi:hypothetical protein